MEQHGFKEEVVLITSTYLISSNYQKQHRPHD